MAVFDSEALNYDSWYKTKLGNFVDLVESNCAMNLFEVKKGDKILDIGCGTGNFSIKLAKAGANVVAIDISDEMLNIAKQKAQSLNLDIEFYNMDTYNLNFSDNFFDGAFSSAAFEFIKEPLKAMNEIFRVVKSGGNIFIGTINRESEWGKLYLSDEFQKNTIFKYSSLKSKNDLKSLKPENLVSIEECLFLPPYVKEEDINMKKEVQLSESERGGFLCALWKK